MVQIILSIGLIISCFGLNADEYIAVDGRHRRLSKKNICTELISRHPEYQCDCCLLKYTLINKMSSDEAFTNCHDENLCAASLDLSPEQALNDAKKNLKPFEIIKIQEFKPSVDIPHNGILDSDALLDIISTLSANQFLPAFISQLIHNHKNNQDIPCLKATALGEKARGVHTGQLFALSINHHCLETATSSQEPLWQVIYIIKESKKGYSELYNLYKVKISPLGQEYVPTKESLEKNIRQHESARITFEDLHFQLTHKNKKRYFSLLQAASGKSLQDQLEKFGAQINDKNILNSEYDNEVLSIKNMFFDVGFSMSKLHQKYAVLNKKDNQKLGKTYIHGDFHGQNVFYDFLSREVTLIDNETFSLALKKRTSGVNDIVDLYLLHTVKTVAHQFSKQLKINTQLGIDDTLWHELWQGLILGYIEAYEFSDSQSLHAGFWEFKAKFYEALSNSQVFDSIKNFKDQRVLKRFGPSMRRYFVKQRYVDQSFSAVQKRLGIENLP